MVQAEPVRKREAESSTTNNRLHDVAPAAEGASDPLLVSRSARWSPVQQDVRRRTLDDHCR
jgi:hypothetical protein